MFPGFLGFSVGNFILALLALPLLEEIYISNFQGLSVDSVAFNRERMENGRE